MTSTHETFYPFYKFYQQMMLGGYDFHNDTLKMYIASQLTDPDKTSDQYKSDVPELAVGNGYVGPVDITNQVEDYRVSYWGTTYEVAASSPGGIEFAASGGAIGPFRYFIIYNENHANDGLICFYDMGSTMYLADGKTLTIGFPTTMDQGFLFGIATYPVTQIPST